MIFNLGMSNNFQLVDFNHMTWPNRMLVDYIRVYQRPDGMIGCDPKERPTADYIKRHREVYDNNNMTTWKQYGTWRKPVVSARAHTPQAPHGRRTASSAARRRKGRRRRRHARALSSASRLFGSLALHSPTTTPTHSHTSTTLTINGSIWTFPASRRACRAAPRHGTARTALGPRPARTAGPLHVTFNPHHTSLHVHRVDHAACVSIRLSHPAGRRGVGPIPAGRRAERARPHALLLPIAARAPERPSTQAPERPRFARALGRGCVGAGTGVGEGGCARMATLSPRKARDPATERA